jgi:hypothetical protein
VKPRSAVLQGALAVAGLAAAYVTWQRPPTLAPGDVTVLNLSKHDLKQVRFESPDRTVVLSRGELNGNPVIWVDEDEHPAANPHAAEKPASAWHRTLVGNEVADKVLDQIIALRATRALGKLDAAKEKELGLSDAKRHLTVEAEGSKVAFAVSTQPAGSAKPYLQRERDGQVFMLGGMLIADLDAASRLVDRKLHAFPPDAFDTVRVTVDGKARSFSVTSHPGAYLPELTEPGAQKPDPKAKAWHDQLWRSYPAELLGRGELPPGGEPKPTVRVDYRERGDTTGWIELARAQDAVWARTEHTAGWVKLGGPAEELLRESSDLVGKAP